MSHKTTVVESYSEAWRQRGFIFLVYVLLQMVAVAVLAPALGALINLAVSLSDQTALTDQDIAMFFLSPVGFAASIAVVAVLLLVEVIGFTFMAAVLRQPGTGWFAARRALGLVASRAPALVQFALRFVLRVLVIALPFVIVGLAVAWWYLTEFDINYYLTYRPPEFMMAVGIIGAIVLVLAVILLVRLSGWALALHLVLFDGVAPRDAFDQSHNQMVGHRVWLSIRLVIWLAIRFALIFALGAIAGVFLNLIPLSPGAGLRVALMVAAAVGLLWMLGGVLISALSLGALAVLLDGLFDGPSSPSEAELPGSLRRSLMLVAGGGLALVLLGFWSGAELLERIKTTDDVEIIGHRGSAGAKPENTMASVLQAIEDKADWVEIDVQETADGQIVVMHDSDFMKLAKNPIKTWDATMEDISKIDIGSWFDPAYSDQRAPLLRDVLQAAKGTDSRVLIELKYYGHDIDLENRVIAIVEDMGMADRVATMSLKYPAVQKMRGLRPDWSAGVLAATAIGDIAGLEADFVAVNSGIATARLGQAVHAAGKDLYVWTVNDPLDMSRMISRGVDGLITDEPALARRVLEARAQMSTPERMLIWLSGVLGLEMDMQEYRDESP